MSGKKLSLMLLRWIGEESLSILKAAKNRSGEEPTVGRTGEYKYDGKFFEGEILALSDKRSTLEKLCKQLRRMEVTREELLSGSADKLECEPDSTADSTSQQTDSKAGKRMKPVKNKDTKIARIKAQKQRAQDMFKKPPYVPRVQDSRPESNTIARLEKELADLRKKVSDKEAASYKVNKEKQHIPQIAAYSRYIELLDEYVCSDTEEEDFEPIQQRITQKKSKSKSYSQCSAQDARSSMEITGDETVSMKDASQTHGKSTIHTQNPKSPKERRVSDMAGVKDARQMLQQDRAHQVRAHQDHPHQDSPHQDWPHQNWRQQNRPYQDQPYQEPQSAVDNVNDTSVVKGPIMKVELVDGYGIYITKKQLDQVILESGESATKMIRNLLTVYFTPTVLAKSSCMGRRENGALDSDIVDACIKYVMDKFPGTKRKHLVYEINDKCANYRRKATTKQPKN